MALGQIKEAKSALEILIKDYPFSQGVGKDNRKALVKDAKKRLEEIATKL
ncbi:MAG: hypothetical protein HQL32_11330 [Planctomycetes bacterium]|nr:hypothetical protein [Planctomycetota bacterium]